MAGGGFVLYTSTVDPAVARDTGAGSLLSQLVLGAIYATALLLFITNREARPVLRGAWPILLLPALALLSALWSPDPLLTLRRAFAFAGTIAFGLSLGAAFRFRATLGIVAFGLALVMALSLVLAFIDPVHAIHQSDDAIQAVHAGYWRGIFAHRNTLGFWSAAAFVTLALAGEEAFGRSFAGRLFLALSLLCAAVCLAASGSSAGLAIVGLAAMFFVVLATTVSQTDGRRGVMLLFWCALGLLALLTFGEIARFGLQLLGRDSDLTGRTELWSYLLDLIRASDKPLGLGYFVGTLLLDQRLSSATEIRNVNAHNGFLEAFVYFGWPGVIIAAGVALWLLVETLRLASRASNEPRFAGLVPAVLVFMALAHNIVESTIVSPNNLNNVLLSVAAAIIARARAAAPVHFASAATSRRSS